MKSSRNIGPAITVGVLVTLALLLAYPVSYIIGPGLLKGGYQTIYMPGIPLPAGSKLKTWGFTAQPVMDTYYGPGKPKPPPHRLMGRLIWVGPFLFLHEAARRR